MYSDIDDMFTYGLYRSEWNNAYGHRFLFVLKVPGTAVCMQVTFDYKNIRVRTNWAGTTWNDWWSVSLTQE